VRREVGFALSFAQMGEKHPSAKPLKGFKGAGVLEIVEDFRGDTYRAIYTVRFTDVVYVLHAFMKKSKSGIKTPKHELELIESRLKWAGADYKLWLEERADEKRI
jgi:phage-related protein